MDLNKKEQGATVKESLNVGELPALPAHPAAVNNIRWTELEEDAIRTYGRACIAAARPAIWYEGCDTALAPGVKAAPAVDMSGLKLMLAAELAGHIPVYVAADVRALLAAAPVAAALATPPASAQAVAPAQVEQEAIGCIANVGGDTPSLPPKFEVLWFGKKPDKGGLLYTRPQAAQPAAQPDTLRQVLEVLRQYPDFDGGTPFGAMIDEALAGKVPSLTAAVDALAAGKQPAAQDSPIGFPDPNAVFADFCERNGYPSDSEMDDALRAAFYEGIRMCSGAMQPAAQVAGLTDAAQSVKSLRRFDHFATNRMVEDPHGPYIARSEVLAILAAKSAPADGGGV